MTVLLSPLAQILETEAPGIAVDIIGLGDSSVERLERGDVDLAIYPERNASEAHPSEALLDDTYSYVFWIGHLLPPEGMTYEHYIGAHHVAA